MALALSPPVHAQQRLALVIGNDDYSSLAKLRNATRDAQAISQVLTKNGFKVELLVNETLAGMSRAMLKFSEQLRLDASATAFFYFSGHAIESRGSNYLAPVEARVRSESDVEEQLVHLGRFMSRISGPVGRVTIVVLDACRDDPFSGRRSSFMGSGLASQTGPRGSLIAYSTAPGAYSSDGGANDGNSPYTKALTQVLGRPGLKIEEAFKLVRKEVVQKTSGEQVPWEATSLMGDFYLVAPLTVPK